MTEPEDHASLLHLDAEVAAWLHQQADAYFSGSVEKAMNWHLSEAMHRHTYWKARGLDTTNPVTLPPDPWARLEANLPPVGGRPAPQPRESPER